MVFNCGEFKYWWQTQSLDALAISAFMKIYH